ncbi:PTS transporter subunit EIIB [Curtobacterium sp. MCPF17_001]|uniref:PTS transporter subunit EIIB n=1 Tax=Curtobacterium sp. MCPF17_001 TaxID=2175651 RepID=UPI0015E8DB95|nr:PTS transporter subunit EIIB [Curtobacterium sp. MCPF17_001]
MPDAQQLAQQILDAVGGSANIADVENCMTRLRVEVVSDLSVALENLNATDGGIAVDGSARSTPSTRRDAGRSVRGCVEQHRTMAPLFQALELVDAGVEDVYAGDPALTDHSWSRLGSFVRHDLVVLDPTAAPVVHPSVIEALRSPIGTVLMLPNL